MNQILVSEKLYITPELKRKKRMYKIDFFISVFLVCILFSYYIYKEFLFSKFFKVMLFLPRVISSVVMVLLFKYIVEDVYTALSGAQYGLLTTHGLPTVLFYNILNAKNTKSTALRSCWRLRRVFLPYFFGQIVVATAMQVGSALFDEGKQW